MRKFRRGIVVPSQRAYVASHPLGLWVAIGITVSGYINLILPHLTDESVAALIFPPLILVIFNLVWAIGGTMSVFGLTRGKPRIEGAGMSLIASGLASYFAAVVSVRAVSALAAVFMLTLAYGCAKRAYHLATHGYVNLDVKTDHPRLD